MRPHERQHPNILEYRDSPPPEESDHGEPAGDHTAGMDNEEEAEDAALEEGHDSEEHGNEMIAYEHSDPEAATTRSVREPPTPPPNYNANTGPASTTITAWAPGRRSSRVNEIINRMEAEGRAMMTEEEVQALNAEFEAAPLEENTSLSYEALFEEGTEDAEEEDVADEAEATASTVPPPARPTTPQPKPKGNQFRKWSPQLYSTTSFDTSAAGTLQPTFQEIETWMRDKAIDVMFIQETKWTEEYCWSNREYNYVHSAGLQKVDKEDYFMSEYPQDYKDFLHICEAPSITLFLH
ncbi:hypothetical protein AK812_SmicGene24421 [Symbiodinium microadriaticum]|uniref:Uncharacterized protein n=1 Tax=Symbiodinium microadriaticum TaxID=2951 RepID=A0A1Q9DEU5_SYMMI|nr:hypothetical protein AK812_SmicGene24421 [Symbiodinium microadriaticum]